MDSRDDVAAALSPGDSAGDRATFDGHLKMGDDVRRNFLAHGQPISENSAPGDITGGGREIAVRSAE